LLWPLALACVMVSDYWQNLLTILAYLAVIGITCVTTANWALFCSVLFRKTSVSLMTAYFIIMVLFVAPLGANRFVEAFFANTAVQEVVQRLGFISPISVCFNLPLNVDRTGVDPIAGDWWLLAYFVVFYGAMNCFLIAMMSWLFRMRWRVMY
jgi:hypothetical protein